MEHYRKGRPAWQERASCGFFELYETKAMYPSARPYSTIWYASRRWRVPLEERSLREREYLIPATAEALRDAHDANAPTPARSFRVGVPGCWSWLLRKVILLRGLEENRDDGSCCGVPVSQVDRHHSVDRGGQSLDDPAGLFSDLGHHLSRVDLVA
jgi:hypothetical protein